jgi:hypothetical protein
VDFSETLYEVRRARAGLSIFQNFDCAELGTFSRMELFRLSELFLDQIKDSVNCLDGVIAQLKATGAKDIELEMPA